jgi:hypothetical protein
MDILPPVSYSSVCHKSSAVALTFTAIQCPTCCLGTVEQFNCMGSTAYEACSEQWTRLCQAYMIRWSQNSFFEFWANQVLDPKRWAIYQTEAIENCYSVWKFQDLAKIKIFWKYKTNCHSAKNGKLLAIMFVVFKYFPFS